LAIRAFLAGKVNHYLYFPIFLLNLITNPEISVSKDIDTGELLVLDQQGRRELRQQKMKDLKLEIIQYQSNHVHIILKHDKAAEAELRERIGRPIQCCI
jgi:hypothetical protein